MKIQFGSEIHEDTDCLHCYLSKILQTEIVTRKIPPDHAIVAVTQVLSEVVASAAVQFDTEDEQEDESTLDIVVDGLRKWTQDSIEVFQAQGLGVKRS